MQEEIKEQPLETTKPIMVRPAKSRVNVLLIVVALALLASNIATLALFFYKKSEPEAIRPSAQIQDANQAETRDDGIDELDVASTTPKTDTNTASLENEKVDLLKKLSPSEIKVEWSEAIIWDKRDFFELSLDSDQKDYSSWQLDIYDNTVVKNVGKIKGGDYADYDLYVVEIKVQEIGVISYIFHAIKKDNLIIFFNNDGIDENGKNNIENGTWGPFLKRVILFNGIKIENYEPAEEIKISGHDYSLVKNGNNPDLLIEEYKNLKKYFEHKEYGDIYKDFDSGCFVLGNKDGTTREYGLKLDFIGAKGEESNYAGAIPNLLNIDWNNGSKNKNEYISKIVDCRGARGCYKYIDYIQNKNELKEVGKTADGSVIFALKDNNFKLPGHDNSMLQEMYDAYYPGFDKSGEMIKKEEFKSFVDSYPLIFYKDTFGDYIEFRNAKYLPSVECGKPVIYLYPETEIDAQVYVAPTGGFTVTEPAYNGGWKVKAKPSGELYNYADKKTYPYLFWEGHGANYSRPDKGFVVARENVRDFLQAKLIKLGLIEAEYNEFIDFWLPRMQEKPFYFVTFMDQADFEKIAPLKVVPTPDQVIRIFMDYEGLDQPVSVVEPKILTPERIGFTVVEWGGALHR